MCEVTKSKLSKTQKVFFVNNHDSIFLYTVQRGKSSREKKDVMNVSDFFVSLLILASTR